MQLRASRCGFETSNFVRQYQPRLTAIRSCDLCTVPEARRFGATSVPATNFGSTKLFPIRNVRWIRLDNCLSPPDSLGTLLANYSILRAKQSSFRLLPVR